MKGMISRSPGWRSPMTRPEPEDDALLVLLDDLDGHRDQDDDDDGDHDEHDDGGGGHDCSIRARYGPWCRAGGWYRTDPALAPSVT